MADQPLDPYGQSRPATPAPPEPQVVSEEQWQAMQAGAKTVPTRPDPASGESMAYLVDPAGKPAVIPEAAAQEALGKGYRPMGDNEVMEQLDPTIHPGAMESAFLHGANKFLLGAPRALSQMGMDKGSLFNLDEVLAAAERDSPTASMAGGIGGEVVSALAGPLGAIGKGAAGLVGGKVASSTGQRALEWGVRGVAEGATIGASKAIDKLHDPETSINDVLASIATGAAWGGVGGVGLSLLGSGAASVTSKIAARSSAKRYGALSEKLNAAIAKPAAKQKELIADLEQHYTRIPATPTSPTAWAPPAAIRDARQLSQQADDVAKMDWISFRKKMHDPMSSEARTASSFGYKATQSGNDQKWLVDKLRGRASELIKEADDVKTASGVKVSQLEEQATKVAEDLGRIRQETIDKFTQVWGKDSPGSLLGQWSRRSAVNRAMGGGGSAAWAAGKLGWMTSNLIGRPLSNVSARISKIVNFKATLRGERTLMGEGAKRGPVTPEGRWGGLAPRAPVMAPSLAELGKLAGKFSVLEAVSAASDVQIERQARLAGRQAQLAFGLPDAAIEPAVQMNIRGLQFLKQKTGELQ